jgi:hypothetical protein
MNIQLNYVSMQSGTMFSLLDLVDHSWTMGLNFGSMVLSQSQNLPLGLICLGKWDTKGGLVFGGRYLLMVGQVKWY